MSLTIIIHRFPYQFRPGHTSPTCSRVMLTRHTSKLAPSAHEQCLQDIQANFSICSRAKLTRHTSIPRPSAYKQCRQTIANPQAQAMLTSTLVNKTREHTSPFLVQFCQTAPHKSWTKKSLDSSFIATASRSLVYDKVKKGSGKMVGVISYSINRHMAM